MTWLRKAAGSTNWDLVRQVAEQVRGGAMVGNYQDPNQGLLDAIPYGKYTRPYSDGTPYPHNPDEDSGGCDQMSEFLVDTLHSLGIKARTVYGWFNWDGFGHDNGGNWEHVWAEVDGRIVDITADQFNEGREEQAPFPRVYISDGHDSRYQESEG